MKKPIIYISLHCPYCRKVQNFATDNSIDVEYKNRDEAKIRDELVGITGKTQVPYLVDAAHDVSMHESLDIIDHLEKYHMGK